MTRKSGFIRIRTAPARQRLPFGHSNEIGFSLCRDTGTGKIVHGPVREGTPTSVGIVMKCPVGSDFIGLAHTHPGGVATPSAQDWRSARNVDASVLCIDADGDLRCHLAK